MDGVQLININTTTFKGKGLKNKIKTVAKNQATHLSIQGSSFCILETISPSQSIMDIIMKKLCIDLGEYFTSLLPMKGKKPFSVKHNILNIFSYH